MQHRTLSLTAENYSLYNIPNIPYISRASIPVLEDYSCLRRHYVKSVQIQSFSGSYFPVFSRNTRNYGPEKTPYLDIFHAVRPSQLLVV